MPCFVFLVCVSHDANKAGTSTAVNPPRRRVSEFLTPLGGIRIHIDAEGKEWYCANDICDRLDIANARDALKSLPDEEKAAVITNDVSSDGTTQRRQMTFISEGG